MKHIKVTIKPEHFRDADEFRSRNCPLGLALKEMGYTIKHIGIWYIGLNGKDRSHNIPDEWGGRNGIYDGVSIDNIIDQAKISLEGIPTVELILSSNIPD